MIFFTKEFVIALVTSYFASCGFAVVFHTNKRHLPLVGVAGLLSYFVYYTVEFYSESLFLAAFISSFAVTFFGEIIARTSHAPALIFIVAGLIPTVPGAGSYYSMKYLIQGESALAAESLLKTGTIAIGIASGLVVVSIVFGMIVDLKNSQKRRHKT